MTKNLSTVCGKMLRRAKSFMVKTQKQETESDFPELSETAHLRRKFIPKQQTVYECIPQQHKKPVVTQENNIRSSFRGLRKQISISVDNIMKNHLFYQMRKTGGTAECGKPVIQVQHNNASRLRMQQVKKIVDK